MSMGPAARTSSWRGIAQASAALLQMGRTDWGGATATALVLYGVLYAVWTAAGWGGPERRVLISDLAFLPVTCVAALLAARTSRVRALDSSSRHAWRLITAAFVCYWIGDLQFIGFELWFDQKPFPSTADAFYLAYYGLLAAGLLRFPRGGAPRLRSRLDVAMVLLGGGGIVWYLVLGPALLRPDVTPVTMALAAAYPVADLFLLYASSVVLVQGSQRMSRAPLYVLGVSLLLFVAADVAYGAQQVSGTYESGGWTDVAFIAAQVLQGVAAQLRYWLAVRPGATPSTTAWEQRVARAVPVTVVIATSVLLLYAVFERGDIVLTGLTVVAVGLIWALLSRQGLLVREITRQLTVRAAQATRLQRVHDAAVETAWHDSDSLTSQRILEDACRFAQVSQAALFRWDPTSGLARLEAATFPVEPTRAAACLRIATHAAQRAEEILATDTDASELAALRAVLGAHSFAAVPLRGAHQIAGVLLAIGTWGDPRLGADELEVLRLLAATTAILRRTSTTVGSSAEATPGADLVSAFTVEARGLLSRVENDLIHLASPELVPGERRELLSTTYRAVHAVSYLLDELDMAQALDRGAVARRRGAVDAVAVALQVAEREQPAYGDRLIRVADRDGRPQALTDADLLQRMLTILLTNTAVHNGSRHPIDLIVGRRPGEVLFEVRDDGVGLSASERSRVWERLYRPASRRSAAQSLGLGLALLKGLVELHGGEVWVDSHATHTRVGFWLPQAGSVGKPGPGRNL